MGKPFFQEYWLYFIEKWRGTTEKDPLVGYVDGFQIDPKFVTAVNYRLSP